MEIFSEYSNENSNPSNRNFYSENSIPSLPKGGGAIRGITENFQVNPVNGSASLSVPLPISEGRGFAPKLSLSYDSGTGNSPFGLGWSIGLPSIQRKTEKQLPLYNDVGESDLYSLGGAEVLIPYLVENSEAWKPRITSKILGNALWEVKYYRPRVEGSYSKIERWRNKDTEKIWWRITSEKNVSTIYGYRDEACISDPENPTRVYKWLIDCSFDDKGNYLQYDYKAENLEGVDLGLSYESHRKTDTLQAQKYLKRTLYGNKESWKKMGLSVEELIIRTFSPEEFHFQTVFDYGEHEGEHPTALETTSWKNRQDPYSNYRAGFEIRTWRFCQRILLYHQFENELATSSELIRSLNFRYTEDENRMLLLEGITSTGFKRNDHGEILSASLPETRFEYQEHLWNTEIKTVNEESISDLPVGIDNFRYQWVDLYSEGVSGILSKNLGSLNYKENLGGGYFSCSKVLVNSPSGIEQEPTSIDIRDLEGNGEKQLITSDKKGFHSINHNGGFERFQSFKNSPSIHLDDANLRLLDLTGDGKSELVITEEQMLRWYPNDGMKGYKEARLTPKNQNDSDQSAILFSNESESIFVGDMSGDGLQDIIRIRNGNIEYWPNLGYGKFGSKVTMGLAPWFDHPDQFDPRRVRLADLDGSGLLDLFYLGKEEFRYWLNHGGNKWSETEKSITPFPQTDSLSQVAVIDFLAEGTACIVWSSRSPNKQRRQLKYINLMGGKKPYLMKNYQNNFGKEVRFDYTPSTHFYLEDKAKGTPWITKLPFPIHCLSRVETIDHISGTRFTNSYTYHHGYYDHTEREFRGFGRVDQLDTEQYEHFSEHNATNALDQAFHQNPVLVKTWFHTGSAVNKEKVLSQYEHEYYSSPRAEDTPHSLDHYRLNEPSLPSKLTDQEWREALRACKGLALRTEIYGLDETPEATIPYTIVERSAEVVQIQPKSRQKHAIFQLINSESLSLQLDRNDQDPRITHQCVLETNSYRQPTVTAAIGYGRIQEDDSLPAEVKQLQAQHHVTISTSELTEDSYGPLGEFNFDGLIEDTYRLPAVYSSKSFELFTSAPSSGTLYTPFELSQQFNNALDVGYENTNKQVGTRRLLNHSEVRFANETLDGELGAAKPNSLGITWKSYQLAFTPDLLEHIYQNKVDKTSHEGGYIDLLGNGDWWTPSGNPIWREDTNDHFFIPVGSRDPFGNESWVELDSYWILPTKIRDAKQNESFSFNDYRLLQPIYQRDSNNNWLGVEVDALGQVVASAVMGKVFNLADEEAPSKNASSEGNNLANPSQQFEYDYHAWAREQKPAWSKSITWEEYFHVNPSRNKTHVQYAYADGSGNSILTKNQTTPGLAKRINEDGVLEEIDTGNELRWIGNGRTILNNKGNPVKQYEPYFSTSPEFEEAEELVETGISPILFYDAIGRNRCKLNPDHTYEKVVTTPWSSATWDANDTLYLNDEGGSKELDPRYDPEVGNYFEGIPESDFLPTWYGKRKDGDLGAEQQQAATHSEKHAATPALTYTDSLGRTIYALANNGVDGVYKSNTELDIESNTVAVVDDRDNIVMSYKYCILPPPDKETPKPSLYQNSMDGGEAWVFINILGQAIKTWDSRGHVTTLEYDELNRQTHSWLETEGEHYLIGQSDYHDSNSTEADTLRAKNLIGTVYQSFEQSGKKETLKLDFSGNILSAQQTFSRNYKGIIDWNVSDRQALLESETFITAAEYDALGRVTKAISPHNSGILPSITRPTYNESGALDKMYVSVRGEAEEIYVEKIEYDAKGQRQKIIYGNGCITDYSYEPDTYRLSQLKTQNGSQIFQDLRYTYDPVGNITHIRDNAHQDIYFNGSVVEPHNTYEYDALYRLISASGREHSTLSSFPHPETGFAPTSHKGDGTAMQNYTQNYKYDSVGNIMEMSHRPSSGGSSSWTRHYQYEDSNNHLLATTLGDKNAPFDQTYTYNRHGSMTSMPHLSAMEWNFAEQLTHVDLQGGGDAYYVYDSSGERARKVIESNGSLKKERLYFGSWEIYRETNGSGLQLERETLHILDDSRRIALVETKTIDKNPNTGFNPIVRYQMENHLGSASLELNDLGEIISYEELYPYGSTAYHAAKSNLELSSKRYRYTGKEKDEETGFSYHSARYLAPWLGRWTAADPIGVLGGVNLYLYAHAHPINFCDNNGCQPDEIWQNLGDRIANWNFLDLDQAMTDPLFAGVLAHAIIETNFLAESIPSMQGGIYLDKSLGSIVRDRIISSSVDFPAWFFESERPSSHEFVNGILRPDIAEWQNGNASGVLDLINIYEIKPVGSEEQGAWEAGIYVNSLLAEGIDARLGNETSNRTAGTYIITYGTNQYQLEWSLSEPGVITYDWHSKKENEPEEEQAAAQKSALATNTNTSEQETDSSGAWYYVAAGVGVVGAGIAVAGLWIAGNAGPQALSPVEEIAGTAPAAAAGYGAGVGTAEGAKMAALALLSLLVGNSQQPSMPIRDLPKK